MLTHPRRRSGYGPTLAERFAACAAYGVVILLASWVGWWLLLTAAVRAIP